MSERDQDFLEVVVKALVDNPEAVKISRNVDEMGVLLSLEVDPTRSRPNYWSSRSNCKSY